MKRITIETRIEETENVKDLIAEDQELIGQALQAAGSAWSPYSRFSVGAAVRLSDGTIVPGCNVENAAFPSGICAEHNALSTASAIYPGKVPVALAVTAIKNGRQSLSPVAPCGKCRQVIAEEETRHNMPIRIILAGSSKVMVIEKGSDLLPLLFSQKDLIPGDR